VGEGGGRVAATPHQENWRAVRVLEAEAEEAPPL
jgi:hypothetical protein